MIPLPFPKFYFAGRNKSSEIRRGDAGSFVRYRGSSSHALSAAYVYGWTYVRTL